MLGIKIHTKDGEQYSQGTLPYILNKTASKFELASIKGNNRYTQWFTNFNANADSKDLNKMRSISSVDIARDSNYEPLLDAKKKIQYELTAKDNATELVENNSSSNSPVEMNTNGELVSVITFEKPTVFTLDSNKTSNFKEIAAKLGWEMGKEYRFEPGKYLLIQGSNNKLRFEQDTGQYTQLNTIYTAIADELPESGAFDNKRVVAEVFSTSNMGKVNEKRAIHAYDVGHANGYNQAYLSLNAWKFKDNEGKYDGSPYNLTIYNNLGFTPYNNPIGLPDGLKATYKGVAYSDRTGKQDGVLNMTAEFGKQDGYYSRQELTFNGSITGRTQNDGRDVYFASGNVKTNSGMPSSNAGTTIYTNDTIKNMTVWMEGKHAEEAKVIYGEGRLRFGGFAAEEVGGILTIKPKDGEENIGFIGKR
nr:hypothetical protein [Alysiella crassa]UOP07366.1 hypothetical protein LVJ80_02730 [Alysiella crassa]